ncbi:MAG TPA: hypothetical protein VJ508_17680 [Saprospiraceae bacterium]|nr:hypothetical protein [Saprospiraceae bacterium]
MKPFSLLNFLLIASALFFFACKENKAPEPTCAAPSGKYVNATVLKNCPAKMPYDVPNFCYEMTFKGTDSVMMDNGFEQFMLPVVSTGTPCEYKLTKASVDGDMLFTVSSDSTIELVDTAWTKVSTFTTFRKPGGANASWDFKSYLNDCLVAGKYAWFKDGQLVPGEIELLPSGDITGMKPYVKYALCYAGDCVGMTEPEATTIDLIDDKGNMETFAYKKVDGKMSIELYSLGQPANPDEKGGIPVGKMVHEWRSE